MTNEDTAIPRRDALAIVAGAAATALVGAAACGKEGTTVTQANAVTPKRASSGRMPAVYLPHGGGPCFFMEWTSGPADTWAKMAAYLTSLATLPTQTPTALLVISAHWEEAAPTVLSAPAPPLLYDYGGFPPHTYELAWPAPGDPTLAKRVRALLDGAGIASAENTSRGFDHGVFIPLKLTYPDAPIPTVQLSLKRGLDPAAHLAIGRALAPLRDEGVYLIGSGMSYHNMRKFNWRGGAPAPASLAFDAWLAETVALPPAERAARLTRWADAPGGRDSHPREEHLLPLMVIAGAAGDDAGRVAFRDEVLGARVAAHHFG